MIVTNVKIKKVDGDKLDRLKAYVDITLDESLVIHGLKLMQGEQGLFVAMPSRKMRNEEYKDIVHPICPDLRNYITKVVEEKYNSIVSGRINKLNLNPRQIISDFTINLSNSHGITVYVSNSPLITEAIKSKIYRHASLRKYHEKSNLWFALIISTKGIVKYIDGVIPKRYETERDNKGVASEKVVAVPARRPIIENTSIECPIIPSACFPNIGLQLSESRLVFTFFTCNM